jgi:head-tail adaptor
MLDARKLDRRIRIERAAPADDGYNETQEWAPLADVWAQYIPSAGQEAREALGREATLPATFVIRWSPVSATIAAGDRLRFPAEADGQIYDIRSAVNVDRRQTIHITAVAGDGA